MSTDSPKEAVSDTSEPSRTMMVPAGWLRRTLAGLIDTVTMSAFGFIATILAYILYVANTGNDFDGSPQVTALGDWFALALLSFFALTYSLLEPLFFAGFGKSALGLRIETRVGTQLSRCRGFARWLIKFSPLILLFLMSLGAYIVVHSDKVDWDHGGETFHDMMWILALCIPLAGCVFHLIWFSLNHGKTLHDRLAVTIVAWRRPLTHKGIGARGFEPILKS